jgi:hypothetical protein
MASGIADIFSSMVGGGAAFLSGIADVTRAIHNTSVNGVSISPDVLGRLDHMTAELSRFNSNVESIQNTGVSHDHTHAHSLSVPFGSFFSWVNENRATVGVTALVCVVFVMCVRGAGSSPLKTAIAGAILGLAAAYVATEYSAGFRKIWDEYYPILLRGVQGGGMHCVWPAQDEGPKVDESMFRNCSPGVANAGNEFVPQAGLDNPFLKACLLIAYVLGFSGFRASTMMGKFREYWNHIQAAPGQMLRTSDTIAWYFQSLQTIANKTAEWIGVSWRCSAEVDDYPQVTALLDEVADFLRVPATSRELNVTPAASICQVLQSRIQAMLIKHKKDRDFHGSERLLTKARAKLEEYDRELNMRGAGRDLTRVPPAAFLFIGNPGIGKSYLLKTICKMALFEMLRDDKMALKNLISGQMRDFIFTRNSCDKFWEGYYNQLIVLLDEVGMQKDVAGAAPETNEYANLIKMVNDVVFPLLMASVENKGTREFNSSLILGTTNSDTLAIESITNPDAYDRRWVPIEIEVIPEFGKEVSKRSKTWMVPDFAKIREAGMSDTDIALSAFMRFRQKKSLLAPGHIGDWMSVHDVISMIKGKLQWRVEEMKIRQNHDQILNDYFAPKIDDVPTMKVDYFAGQEIPSGDLLPGDFKIQSGGECPCRACTQRNDCVITDIDAFNYSAFLRTMLRDQVQSQFSNGYDHVETTESYLYTEEIECISVLREKNPHWDDAHLVFTHGAQVKSRYLRTLDLAEREARRDRMLRVAKMVAVVGTSFLAIYSLWKIGSAVFGGGARPQDDDRPSPSFVPQYFDQNSRQIMESVAMRNLYSVGDEWAMRRGFVCFLAGQIAVMPYHFIIRWRQKLLEGSNENAQIHFRRVGDRTNHQVINVPLKFFARNDIIVRVGDEDLCAVLFDNRVFHEHQNIRKYLSAGDLSRDGLGFLPIFDHDLRFECKDVKWEAAKPMTYDAYGQPLSVTSVIQYALKTEAGDCGVPLFARDPMKRADKFIGFHVAGTGTIGLTQHINQKHFDQILEMFAKHNKYSPIEVQFRSDAETLEIANREGKGWNDLFPVPEHRIIPGKVNLALLDNPPIPTKTSIVKSPLNGKLKSKPRTRPAWLREFENRETGEVIDPISLSTEKYHLSTAPIDTDVLDMCVANYTRLVVNSRMIQKQDEIHARVLEYEEAVAGIAGIDGLDGIPRGTSAAVPWCMKTKGKGKRGFFGEDGDYQFGGYEERELRATVDRLIASAKTNKRELNVFFDFPKDERRPIEKAMSGKTRKISACPLHLTIAIRMYFGSFVQNYMLNRIWNHSAVGINVFSCEWDQIAQFLGTDNRIIAGDFSNYDGHLPYSVMIRFLDTCTAYYGDAGSENERVRAVLFQDIVNSRHLLNGVVYEWVGSNASGNPLTTVLNSWCNNVILRYATLECVGKCNTFDASGFLNKLDSYVRFMVYGDDNLIAVIRGSPFAEFLTQDRYTDALGKMGLKYTDEEKGAAGSVSQDRGIEDVSFLKRKWARTSLCPSRKFLSPLAIETIVESVQWTKRRDFAFENVRDNCDNMLIELSQHPRDVFDEYAQDIVAAAREHLDYTPTPSSYSLCQVLARTREKVW